MISLVLSILLLFLSVIIWKLRKTFSYWEGTGIPHHSLFGYIKYEWTRTKVPYHEHNVRIYKELPKIFGSYQGFSPRVIVSDPELIKQSLVKEFMSFADRFDGQRTNHKVWDRMLLNTTGEEWRAQRNVMMPAFSGVKLKQMVPVIAEMGDHVVEAFLKVARNGQISEIKKIYESFAVDTIARLAFATNLNSHDNPNNSFVKHSKGIFSEQFGGKFTLLLTFPEIFRFFRMTFISEDTVQFFVSLARTVIQKKLESKSEGTDLLQLLLNSKKSEEPTDDVGNEQSEKKKEVLSMDDIIAQVVMFFIVANDTTTMSLLFTTYQLAINPEAQKKVIEEVDRIVGKGPVTYKSVAQMHYLEAAIHETLRLGATDPFILRMCTSDTSLAGIEFKRGMYLEIPMCGLHTDPEYFPEPEKFKLERFLPENKSSIHPYTYLAFGEGPRHCIGKRLVLLEVKICLAKVFQKVQFERCSETMVPLKFKTNCFLPEPTKPIVLKISERSI